MNGRVVFICLLVLTLVQVGRSETPAPPNEAFETAFNLLHLDDPKYSTKQPDEQEVSAALAILKSQPDSAACLNLLGLISREGWFGEATDEDAAIGYFRRAWGLGDSIDSLMAAINLANTLAATAPFNSDRWVEIEKAARTAIDQESVGGRAAALIGQAIVLGPDNKERLPEAEAYLLAGLADDPKDGDTRWLLARGYDNGWFGDPDPETACGYFITAAEVEDHRAFWRAGMCFLDGTGVAADEAVAFDWVKRAAQAGDQQGMISLAVMYAKGQGTNVSALDAADWYDRAIRRGGEHTAHALRGLGAMNLYGELGEESDQLLGMSMLELGAAEDGMAEKILGQVGPLTPSQREVVDQEIKRVREEYKLPDPR